MTTVENKKTTRFQKYITGPGPAYSLVYCDFFGLGCIIPLLPFFCKDFDRVPIRSPIKKCVDTVYESFDFSRFQLHLH